MALVRRLVELGRAARAGSSVRTRQPLGRALVAAPGWDTLPTGLRAQITDELNVAELVPLGEAAGDLVDVTVKANFRSLGRRFGKQTQPVAAAVAAADPSALVAALRRAGEASVVVDGEQVTLGTDDVVVTETPREGWAVESAAGDTVALDLEITPTLRRAGLAREVVRLVQEARKSSGLQVSDRIELWWAATSDELAQSLHEHGDLIAGEVLATTYLQGAGPDGTPSQVSPELGLTYWLRRA